MKFPVTLVVLQMRKRSHCSNSFPEQISAAISIETSIDRSKIEFLEIECFRYSVLSSRLRFQFGRYILSHYRMSESTLV